MNEKTVQEAEVEWYKKYGRYPHIRIRKTTRGQEYVVGDWSWNRDKQRPTEYFEPFLYPEPKRPIRTAAEINRNKTIWGMKDAGLAVTEIAKMFGISRQRVHQIWTKGEGLVKRSASTT